MSDTPAAPEPEPAPEAPVEPPVAPEPEPAPVEPVDPTPAPEPTVPDPSTVVIEPAPVEASTPEPIDLSTLTPEQVSAIEAIAHPRRNQWQPRSQWSQSRPSKKGTFTAAAKKAGKSVQAEARAVLADRQASPRHEEEGQLRPATQRNGTTNGRHRNEWFSTPR